MAGDGFSGLNGTARRGGVEVCEVTKWNFDETVDVPKYASNCTAGRKHGDAGVADAKGSIEIKIPQNGTMQMKAGTRTTLKLEADGSGNNYLQFEAIISGSPIEVDIDGGAIVSATYNYEAIGAITRAGIFAIGDGNCCSPSSSGA